MFTISASSTAARPTVVAHRRANKTRAKRSVVVHGAKVRERDEEDRERAWEFRCGARARRGARGRRRGDGGRDEATAIARGVSSRGLARARAARTNPTFDAVWVDARLTRTVD